MRSNWIVLVVALSLSFAARAQDDAPKLKVSGESLTREQAAVYRAVLQDIVGDSKDTLNLAYTTEPLTPPGALFNGACPKTSQPQVAQDLTSIVHHLDAALVLNLKIALVDPGPQEEKIKKGDPAILMKRVIDDRQEVPQKQIDDATERAVKNGLLTLSEIIFNKKHNRALVSYSFVCGELCGYGNVLVLTKVGEKWKIYKTCEGWVS
jgi:hypothetical protein